MTWLLASDSQNLVRKKCKQLWNSREIVLLSIGMAESGEGGQSLSFELGHDGGTVRHFCSARMHMGTLHSQRWSTVSQRR